MQTEGYIHSIQSFGTLDGPGVRYVIFMQGCALGCVFCHNPDTWRMVYGRLVSVDWLVEEITQYIPYFKSAGGGVTVSGGEPLLQADFLGVLFRRLGYLRVHRALDTSGFAEVERVKELLDLTDLVLLSIKHADAQRFHDLTGHSPRRTLAFARYLTRIGKPVWIRYVIIPGYTNSASDLSLLSDLIAEMPNVQRLELLPYNDLGEQKWADLGRPYGLTGVKPPTAEEMARARELVAARLPDLKVV